jgi:hypothetical protein
MNRTSEVDMTPVERPVLNFVPNPERTQAPLSEVDRKTLLYIALRPFWKRPPIKLPTLQDQADLASKDAIGPDPFHLRRAPKSSLLDTYYHASDYPQLFASLDLAVRDKPPVPMSIDTPVEGAEIPKLMNFIWIGDDFKNERFRANIARWIEKNPEFTRVIWTDNRKMSDETLLWCRSNGIHLVHIDDVFAGKNKMVCDEHYRLERQRLPACWGGASDILRYNILDRFGGAYIDVDKSDSKTIVCNGKTQITDSGNDFIFIVPHKMAPIFKLILERYNYDSYKLEELIFSKNDALDPREFRILEVMIRTGPDVFYSIKGMEAEYVKFSERNAGTWLQKPWQTSPALSDKSDLALLRKKIITNLIWNLKNEPRKFDLLMYCKYLNLFEAPKKEEGAIIEFILKNYPHLLERVDEIHVSCPEHLESVLKFTKQEEILYSNMLFVAVERGCYPMVCYFLQKGVSQDCMGGVRDQRVLTTDSFNEIKAGLPKRADAHYRDLTQEEFMNHFDLNSDYSGRYPIHFSLYHKDARILEKILETDPRQVDKLTVSEECPLSEAIRAMNPAAIRIIMKYGPNIDEKLLFKIMEKPFIYYGFPVKNFYWAVNIDKKRDVEHPVEIEEAIPYLRKILGAFQKSQHASIIKKMQDLIGPDLKVDALITN